MLIRLASVYRSVNIGQKPGAKKLHNAQGESLTDMYPYTLTQSHRLLWKFNLCQNTRHIPQSLSLVTRVQATWGAEDNIMRRQQQHWG